MENFIVVLKNGELLHAIDWPPMLQRLMEEGSVENIVNISNPTTPRIHREDLHRWTKLHNVEGVNRVGELELLDLRSILKALTDFTFPDELTNYFVYAVRDVRNGQIRIGLSQDPVEQFKDTPFQLIFYKRK